MTQILLGLLLLTAPFGRPAAAQDFFCESVFASANAHTADFFQESLDGIEDGLIPWDSTDWEQLVRQEVMAGEFYLDHCTAPEIPLAEQPDAAADLAAQSQILPPVASVDVGGDFADLPLTTDFAPTTQLLDLDGDGTDDLILHTQVPYFSAETVYGIRGGLSIAFFLTEDGYQGQVIAPVTEFVTMQDGPHLTYAQTDPNALSVDTADQALNVVPAPEVSVQVAEDGTPLTFITLQHPTPAGEAKELTVLSWDDRIPNVELRVWFDDWCSPGHALDWTIYADASVDIPSNGGEEGSPLHCGRTPEARFEWADGAYTQVE